MCGAGRNKTMQASQRGTCQHSQPASHYWATRAHNQHHIAESKPITHSLQKWEGSRCMCGVGQNKKSRQVRGAHASIACQHSLPASHIWETRAHSIHHMAGSNTHPRIEGTQQAPHGGQQADHSPAAEIGEIQMHVWGRAKENNAG